MVPTGVSHISSWLQKYNQGSGRKEQTNKWTIWAWVNSSARRLSCDTLHSLCICRLTLAWISSEFSTKVLGMPTHLDWSSLTAAGLYLMPTGLSDVRCRLQLPFCVSRRQLFSLDSFVQPLSLAFPYPLPVMLMIAGSGLCLVLCQNRQRDHLLSGPPT